MKWSLGISLLVLISACTTMAFTDPNAYIIDQFEKNNLRAHDPVNDRDFKKYCDPETLPSGKIAYKCVAELIENHDALVNKINELESQLITCQQGVKN